MKTAVEIREMLDAIMRIIGSIAIIFPFFLLGLLQWIDSIRKKKYKRL